MIGFLRRALVRTAAATLLAAILGALPAALVSFIGWPLPTHLPAAAELGRWVATPITDQVIVNALAVAAWLLWAAFLHAVAAEARAAFRGQPTVAITRATANPLRLAAASLVTAITLGTTLGGAALASPQPAHASPPTRAAHATTQSALAAPEQTITVRAGARAYVVKRHDTLSKVAADWLGDANRWPEICTLNYHRHYPGVGGVLTDCNLIYPGWDLFLPADATPPVEATPAPPPAPTIPAPAPPAGDTPDAPVPPSASAQPSQPDDGVVLPPPAAVAPSTPAGSPSPDASRPPSTTPSPTAPASPAPSTHEAPAPAASDQGITLPGVGYLPWALASAITAAAAMVWLQRRRRRIYGQPDSRDFAGDPSGDAIPLAEPVALPEAVTELHRHVARHVGVHPDLVERAAAVPALPQLPPGGVGLTGDGALSAARAALVAALASGGPGDPDRRGEVVIDGTTLTTLIGADAAALGPWPRLHVADDLDHALTILDSRLLHRARILDEHSLDDLDTLRRRAPSEEALPPVLLITETPPPGARMRARVSFGLGNNLDVTALLLGPWSHGSTVEVDDEGHTDVEDADADPGIGDRLAVLDSGAAVAILATLREAHTGEPNTIALPAPALRAAPPAAEDAPDWADLSAAHDSPTQELEPVTDGYTPDSADEREHRELESVGQEATRHTSDFPAKAQLRVFGQPRVEDLLLPGRALRAKAAELAVYLACHPDGADTHTIGEYLAPESRVRLADQQVHTNASNLRHVLGRAGGPRPSAYVVKRGTNARYRLDPATVDVDLWQLRDLLQRAQLGTKPSRTDLLWEACALCTTPLAQGCDYDWIEPHREHALRLAVEAHVLLAEDLLDDDPPAAGTVIDTAITLDRHNEDLYCKAMHARAAAGDADGIRALLRAVTKALADLDVAPQDSTIELATRLRSALGER